MAEEALEKSNTTQKWLRSLEVFGGAMKWTEELEDDWRISKKKGTKLGSDRRSSKLAKGVQKHFKSSEMSIGRQRRSKKSRGG